MFNENEINLRDVNKLCYGLVKGMSDGDSDMNDLLCSEFKKKSKNIKGNTQYITLYFLKMNGMFWNCNGSWTQRYKVLFMLLSESR